MTAKIDSSVAFPYRFQLCSANANPVFAVELFSCLAIYLSKSVSPVVDRVEDSDTLILIQAVVLAYASD